eukprot:384859-Rhodomonas_salina.1
MHHSCQNSVHRQAHIPSGWRRQCRSSRDWRRDEKCARKGTIGGQEEGDAEGEEEEEVQRSRGSRWERGAGG